MLRILKVEMSLPKRSLQHRQKHNNGLEANYDFEL